MLRSLLRYLIRFYQIALSPMLGPRCRYIPTCSQYALDAIALHGALRGSYLATRRICRCHPWGGSGYDPVPRGAAKYICFKFIHSQTCQVRVPFRVRFMKPHHSNHLG